MAAARNLPSEPSAASPEYLGAAHVSMGRQSVRVIDADHATLEQAAVQRLRAGHAAISGSNVGFVNADRVTVSEANVGAVIGKSVAADDVRTLVLAAPVVRGDVHTLVDLRTAFALGIGIALGKAVLGLLSRDRK